jgi:hypothetical protein
MPQFVQELPLMMGNLSASDPLVVRFRPSQAPGRARGLGLVSCGATQTRRSAALEWRTPEQPEE